LDQPNDYHTWLLRALSSVYHVKRRIVGTFNWKKNGFRGQVTTSGANLDVEDANTNEMKTHTTPNLTPKYCVWFGFHSGVSRLPLTVINETACSMFAKRVISTLAAGTFYDSTTAW